MIGGSYAQAQYHVHFVESPSIGGIGLSSVLGVAERRSGMHSAPVTCCAFDFTLVQAPGKPPRLVKSLHRPPPTPAPHVRGGRASAHGQRPGRVADGSGGGGRGGRPQRRRRQRRPADSARRGRVPIAIGHRPPRPRGGWWGQHACTGWGVGGEVHSAAQRVLPATDGCGCPRPSLLVQVLCAVGFRRSCLPGPLRPSPPPPLLAPPLLACVARSAAAGYAQDVAVQGRGSHGRHAQRVARAHLCGPPRHPPREVRVPARRLVRLRHSVQMHRAAHMPCTAGPHAFADAAKPGDQPHQVQERA